MKNSPNFSTLELRVWKLVIAGLFLVVGFSPNFCGGHIDALALKQCLCLQVNLPFGGMSCPCFVSLSIFKNLASPVVLVHTSLSTSFAFCIYRCLMLQRFWCPWEAVTILYIWKGASSFNQMRFEKHGWIYSI